MELQQQQQQRNQCSLLPPEILNEIFSILAKDSKRQVSPCALVCRSWYFLSQRFFDSTIRVAINDSKLGSLFQDLTDFPVLASKISHLRLDIFSSGESGEQWETFRSIINCCANLVELKFDNNDVFHYLKALNTGQAKLPKIEKIQIAHMQSSSPAVRRFHLWVNYRFRTTIKSLEIVDLGENHALKNYGGLMKMLAYFPNLAQLKAKSLRDLGDASEFDLTSLLETCPALQELKLYNIQTLKITESPAITYDNLTKLKLKLHDMDIKTLDTITTRLVNINKLRLITPLVLPDNSLTFDESTSIINNFKTYANKMERANIFFTYRGEVTNIHKGKATKKFWGSNTIFMVGLPNNFHDHLIMQQIWAEQDVDFDEMDDDDDYGLNYFGDDFGVDFDDEFDYFQDEHEELFRQQQEDLEDAEEEERINQEIMDENMEIMGALLYQNRDVFDEDTEDEEERLAYELEQDEEEKIAHELEQDEYFAHEEYLEQDDLEEELMRVREEMEENLEIANAIYCQEQEEEDERFAREFMGDDGLGELMLAQEDFEDNPFHLYDDQLSEEDIRLAQEQLEDEMDARNDYFEHMHEHEEEHHLDMDNMEDHLNMEDEHYEDHYDEDHDVGSFEDQHEDYHENHFEDQHEEHFEDYHEADHFDDHDEDHFEDHFDDHDEDHFDDDHEDRFDDDHEDHFDGGGFHF